MAAWVFPDHDHVIVIELSTDDSKAGIGIHASHEATGEACERCNQAVRRLGDLFRQFACGWFGLAPTTYALGRP